MKLVFLQNAWFKRRLTWIEPEWSPEWKYTWLYALHQCRSGQKLKLLLGDDWYERGDTEVTNSTPEVGYGSSKIKLPADPVWIEREIERVKPTLVVTCGTQALESVAPLWHGPLVAVPHPACRVLTNDLYLKARCLIRRPPDRLKLLFDGRVVMDQLRDKRVRYSPINNRDVVPKCSLARIA